MTTDERIKTRKSFAEIMRQTPHGLTRSEQTSVCLDDLVDMFYSEPGDMGYWSGDDPAECFAEWRRRIGGAFQSYARTLLAGRNRR